MKKIVLIAGIAACILSAAGWYYWQQSLSPKAIAQKVARAYLNDPDSAIFEDVKQSKSRENIWCGNLNARTKMGGYGGFKRFIVELHKDKKSPNTIDTARAAGDFVIEDESVFNSIWYDFCRN